MDDCIELKAGIKQLLDYEAVLICFEHIQHKVKLVDLFEQAKAEAYQAGRKAGLGEARERLDAMADDYSVQADKALDSYGPVPYYTCLDKANALREGASAIKALVGDGE